MIKLELLEQVENYSRGIEQINDKLQKNSLSPEEKNKLTKKIKQLALSRKNNMTILKCLPAR